MEQEEQKSFDFGSAGFNDCLNWDDDKYLTLKSPYYFGIYFKTVDTYSHGVMDIIISKFSISNSILFKNNFQLCHS